ncbi:hypothetical protein [Noviluteimonas gilva]|uniref:Uncharacterized protein n=1 Tax=Noviluteimonas gilva TaxID=2682097 RepID=A0A7C9HNX7_9GAMM|nr:hypothetical protein [Lysobacter gilvus]MUV15430.1 hypothetical protein [Lysobacter gilvus]
MELREIEMETKCGLVLARVERFEPSRAAWSTVAYLVRDSNTWKRSFETGSTPNEALAAAREFMREMAASNG